VKVPLSSVNMTDLEMRYVNEAAGSGWISGSGPFVDRFEAAIAQRTNRKYVVGVNSGTSALVVALLALGVGPGDEVIVPALTFVAPAAAVRSVGALPVFCDIERDSWTIAPASAAALITDRTRAIVAVDVCGMPCDFASLHALGVPILEDAAEAHGASLLGRPAGSFGVASVLSFHANKAITTGEGGCVATDDLELATKVRLIAGHGMTAVRPYWHTAVGRNVRMTNIVAAFGTAQAERWDDLIDGRRAVASKYERLLRDLPVVIPSSRLQKIVPSCWLYAATLHFSAQLIPRLRADGVDARQIWPALVNLPLYRAGVRIPTPMAEQASAYGFWLPTWSGMPSEAVELVAERVMAHAGVLMS